MLKISYGLLRFELDLMPKISMDYYVLSCSSRSLRMLHYKRTPSSILTTSPYVLTTTHTETKIPSSNLYNIKKNLFLFTAAEQLSVFAATAIRRHTDTYVN